MIAATTAAGIATEHEGDTWTGLIATDLTGPEILRAKAIGALRRWRWAGGAVVGLWTAGLLAGAIHPLGYALTLAEFAVFTGFALSLGSWISVRSRGVGGATGIVIGILFFVNIGYLFLWRAVGGFGGMAGVAPCMPFLIAVSPARYDEVMLLFGRYPSRPGFQVNEVADHVAAAVVGMLGYGFLAAVLAVFAVDGFDRAADRPARARPAPPRPQSEDD